MSNGQWDDEEDDANDGSQNLDVPQLRKHARALEREVKALRAEKVTWTTSARAKTVADVLKDKGYDPDVSELIPESLTSQDEINGWLEKNSRFLAKASDLTDDTSVTDDKQKIQDPNLQALAAIASAQKSGVTHSGDEAQMAGAIAGADSVEALNTLLFGNPNGPVS